MGNTATNSFKPAGILLITLTMTAIWFSLPGARGQADPGGDGPTPVTPVSNQRAEHFVPNPRPMDCAGTLEVQKTATITGEQIHIRQVVRWSDADAAAFAAVGDLIIDRFDGTGNRKLGLDEIQSTLSSAGVNMATVRFSGATSCLVTRNVDEAPAAPAVGDHHAEVKQWIDQGNKNAASQPAQNVVDGKDIGDVECGPFFSLRVRIMIDLAQRLNLPIDQLQVTFDPKDKSYLNLTEPSFRFEIEPHRVRDLGQVSWDVTIMSGENQQKLLLVAGARCWEREIVMNKAAMYKQVLQDDDVAEKRVLVDHVPDDQLLTKVQVVGQQAARDLKPGTVLTGRLIDPVPLAKTGQYVTVTLNQGGVQVKTVGRAMESGSFGQTIKVKNEQTQDVFEATLTGPQTACMGPAPAPEAKLAGADRDFVH